MNMETVWPKGFEAAISLTYDDGLENQLDQAIPDLESAGFKGTFYLTSGGEQVQNRKKDWKKAFNHGHEIGNHTFSHPGRGIGLKPENNLSLFNYDKILLEIKKADDFLKTEIGKDPFRSFAYPYGHSSMGIGEFCDEKAYLKAIQTCCYGARVCRGINNPLSVNKYRLLSFGTGEKTPLKELSDYCEKCLALKHWGILVFHGVGGPWLETERQVHQALIEYLKKRAFYVAPVRDILQYLEKNGGKFSEDC